MRKHLLIAAIAVLTLAAIVHGSSSAVAATVAADDGCSTEFATARSAVIGFDDRSGGETITDQYRGRGVEFVDGTAIAGDPPISAHSGSMAAHSYYADLGSAGRPIRMTFRKPMAAIGVYVGRESPGAFSDVPVRARLSAHGINLYGTTTVLAKAEVELPPEATGIERCLFVVAPPGTAFSGATIEYAAYGEVSASDKRWIDDLMLSPSDDPAAPFDKAAAALGLAAPPASVIEQPAAIADAGSEAWRWQAAIAAFGLALMLSCFVGWHWAEDARSMSGLRRPSPPA